MRHRWIKADDNKGFVMHMNLYRLLDVTLLSTSTIINGEPVLRLTLVAGQEIELKGDAREKFLACDPFSQKDPEDG